MSVFKEDAETKRVIFNVRLDLARRLEQAKETARAHGKRLDADTAVDKALEKFLKKAERKLEELVEKHPEKRLEATADAAEMQDDSGQEGQPDNAEPGDALTL